MSFQNNDPPVCLLCSTISQIWHITNMAPTNKSDGKGKYFRKKTREIQWRKVIVWRYFALKIMSSGKLFVLHYRLPRVKKWNKKSFSFFFSTESRLSSFESVFYCHRRHPPISLLGVKTICIVRKMTFIFVLLRANSAPAGTEIRE